VDRQTKGLAVAAAAIAVTLAGCATGSAPRGISQVRLDPQAEAQASAFEGFMRQARGIDPSFSNPASVAQALTLGSAYEPRQMEAGMVAYAAAAALQEPKFVAGVRKAAGRGKADMAKRLAARPDLATDLPGADAAAARANGALWRQGEALTAGGQGVKKASYGVQRQAWSRVFVTDPKGRLSRVKQISGAGYQVGRGDQGQLYQALAEGGRREGRTSPVVARGMAVAALSVLGEPAKAKGLLAEPKSGMCVRLAKLNLYQCLASAGPYYEDIYCLGQHAMIDPGQCVLDAAGKAPPAKLQKASLKR
jgi:hypothetical protein